MMMMEATARVLQCMIADDGNIYNDMVADLSTRLHLSFLFEIGARLLLIVCMRLYTSMCYIVADNPWRYADE